jgi:hypothetical protein
MTNEEQNIIARNAQWAKENTQMKKDKITKEESKLAMQAQSPVDEARHETKAIAKVSTFKQLAKVSRSARYTFGGTTTWIQPANLFNESYRNGLESVPFFVTKAWEYTSKSGYGQRLGMEIVLSDGKMFMVGLGLNEGDIKRNNLIQMFQDQAEPIGPFMLTKLPTNKGNDYYDLNPFEPENTSQSTEISFVAIDEDVPF